MTVAQSLKNYLNALSTNASVDTLRKALAQSVEELLKSMQKERELYDVDWYLNRSFMDGDHWAVVKGRKILPTSSSVADEEDSRLKRTINLVKAVIRGLRNFVLKVPLTVEVSPDDESEEAKAEAKRKNAAWRAIEREIGFDAIKRDIVSDGFEKYAGYAVVMPVADGIPKVQLFDAFDVYVDHTAADPRDGQALMLATAQNVAMLKDNQDYENTEKLAGDGRRAASDMKNYYEKQQSGGTATESDDLKTTILKQAFIRANFTYQEAEDGPGRVVDLPKGETHTWIISVAEGEVLRHEETTLKRFPIPRYCPEKRANSAYGKAWINDIRPINKAINTQVSAGEEWHIKARPKLLVPSDSKLKEVTNVTAEVLEYDKRIPAGGIHDYMPSGLPASFFSLVSMLRDFFGDVGGLHDASGGKVPVGVKSGAGIERLQAADAEFNMAEPLANWSDFFRELAETVLEQVAENVVTKKTLTYDDQGETKSVSLIGRAGTVGQNGEPIPTGKETVVITPSKVKVTAVPAIAYTEAGKQEVLSSMYGQGAIDRKTYLEGYRFSNVADIVERAALEEAQKAKQPTPPPPVPADKLMQGLAALAKSGEPITFEQVQAVMEQAGLPPAQDGQVPPMLPSGEPSGEPGAAPALDETQSVPAY